jgi:Icc-related predicted phosphoesterase
MRLLAAADQAPHIPLATLVKHHRPDAVVLLGDLDPDWVDPLWRFEGLTLAGFQGSVRYKPNAPFQYTQKDAAKLARRLPKADVLLSHSPPRGVHEEPDDRAHEGFDGLRAYIEEHQPRYAIHGHTPAPPRGPTRIGRTQVIHVVGARLLELPGP